MRELLPVVLAVAVAMNGCMTMISGSGLKPISVSSDPANAIASAGGQVCRTPGTMLLERTEDHDLHVTKQGYAPKHVKVESHHQIHKWALSLLLNACHGVFTLGITFVIGMAVDVATGSLQDLEPTSVFVPLERWETAPLGDPDGEQ